MCPHTTPLITHNMTESVYVPPDHTLNYTQYDRDCMCASRPPPKLHTIWPRLYVCPQTTTLITRNVTESVCVPQDHHLNYTQYDRECRCAPRPPPQFSPRTSSQQTLELKPVPTFLPLLTLHLVNYTSWANPNPYPVSYYILCTPQATA